MQLVKVIFLVAVAMQLGGCVLTKIVSVPMRAVGTVISIIPVAGNTAHDAIDQAAEIVDEVPI